jgi:ribosomal protein L40E
MTPGDQTLTVIVNPDHTLIEGGLGYANDIASIAIHVAPPEGTVYLTTPTSGTTFGPTDSFVVTGVVRDASGNGISNLTLTIDILASDGSEASTPVNTTTDQTGVFQYTLTLNNLRDGTYTLRVFSTEGLITAATPSIVVKQNLPFLSQPVPLLGIPWWLFLIIIAAVAAIAIGVTVYFRVYGLGKMVECGECGAFIPEDATVCPKCGVEFEKDMAKCSNCQAWIPVDVKQCPECGVEFATGEVEMADYQEKMRLQYDEVVQKFKEDASRQLGRALSDKEFQEWWRKQPTFLTFEDWLREEEEMRKMGSRPCPVCGTLNSVTATVCHKCGSLMKEQRPPSGGAGSGGLAPSVRQRAEATAAPPSGPSDQGGAQAGTDQGTVRRVIRRPLAPAPVVQKKVIKRPIGEGEQASTEGEDQQSDDKTQEDEL